MVEIIIERGKEKMELAELKTLSCCPSQYNMAPARPSNRVHVRAGQESQCPHSSVQEEDQEGRQAVWRDTCGWGGESEKECGGLREGF